MIKMGKKIKMKLPFLSKTTEEPSSWPWPSCGKPKNLSFRAAAVDTPEPLLAASESGSFSDEEAGGGGGESIEAVIRRLRTADRLFSEPGGTSSMVKEDKKDGFPMQERTVVMAMESMNPREDFKTSMAEMVEAHGHGLKKNWDWEFLEELLSWYLRINGKNNHGYIVGAFVDLLLDRHAFASSSCSSSSSSSSSSGDDHYNDHDHDQSCSCRTIDRSPTRPFSFSSSNSCTSRCLSSLEAEDEIEKPVDNGSSSESQIPDSMPNYACTLAV